MKLHFLCLICSIILHNISVSFFKAVNVRIQREFLLAVSVSIVHQIALKVTPAILFSVRTSLRMTFKAIVRVTPLGVDGPRVYCVGPHDIWFTCRHADTNLSRHKWHLLFMPKRKRSGNRSNCAGQIFFLERSQHSSSIFFLQMFIRGSHLAPLKPPQQ